MNAVNEVDLPEALSLETYEKMLVSYLKKINDVNSYHNYGMTEVSDKWEILAESSDGIIKAISHKQKKILAHMWHPEREQPFFDKAQMKLIKQFIEEGS